MEKEKTRNPNDYTTQHNKLRDLIMLALQAKFPQRIRLWKRDVGLVQLKSGGKARFNQPGQADIWGVCLVLGRPIHIEIEVKSGKDISLSKHQKNWKEFCDKFSIPHLVATSEEQAIKFIEMLDF